MLDRELHLKLESDEAAVVAPVKFWDRLVEWFHQSAEEFPENADGWVMAAEHVEKWVNTTALD